MAKDIFDDIAGAEVTQRADRIKPGRYIFDVKNLSFGAKRKGNAFIAEFVVAEAHGKERDDKGQLIPPTEVGTTIGHMACFWGKTLDNAPGNTKAAICAIFGEDPKGVSKQDFKDTLEELFSVDGHKKQPARGRRVAGETNASEKDGEVRHFLNLAPVQESLNLPDKVAERRKKIEAGGAEASVDVE